MIITDIKRQVNNKNKFSIFVDGKYYNSLFDETLKGARLQIGDEITDKEFETLQVESQKKLAFNKSLDYLGHRIRAINEVREYLEKKEYCEEAIEYTIEKLKEYKYVDDRNFANVLVRDRMNAKSKGKTYIINNLKKYKISQEIIQEIIENYNYDKEYENALNLAEKLYKKHAKVEDEYKKKQKISSAMARAGFDWDTIKSAMNDISAK
ncbi:MAG: RecX family transcriptional regulator [Eubacteriales bacterium]